MAVAMLSTFVVLLVGVATASAASMHVPIDTASLSAGPVLQGLAGTSAASNAASNTGASAAAAVSSAVTSLGQTLGAKVTSVADIQVQLEELLLQFCSGEKFTAPEKVPAKWTGSGATIALVPHTCLIYPENNTLACSPAQLVLYKTAGSYNKAYTSAAEWSGKECKIQEQLGKDSAQLIGGANYTVKIPQPVQLKSLWMPIFANEDADAPAPAAGGASAAASVADSSSSKPSKKPSKPTKGSSNKPFKSSGKPAKKPSKPAKAAGGTSASAGGSSADAGR